MKNQPTEQQQKNQFRKSLGSGVKSVFGGKGRKYFVLEHRTHSTKHKAGEVQEIIVDYVEMGRDSKCQVRFGEDMKTVSGRHAAIVSEGDKWIIKQLSKTNQTLVNGRPVANQWYLESGDEIQLSLEGPKMGFIVPQVNTVSSLGLSKRLSLFRQQALRPYKTAITVLMVLFVLGIAGLSYGIWNANQKTAEVIAQMENYKELSQQQADSLRQQLLESEELRLEMADKITRLEGSVSNISRSRSGGSGIPAQNQTTANQYAPLFPGVYQVILLSFHVDFDGDLIDIPVDEPFGSGFMLDDGRFITARHVVEPWYYAAAGEEDLLLVNAFEQMGAEITFKFKALSPSGTSFTFTNHDVITGNSNFSTRTFVDSDGEVYMVEIADIDYTDWASMNVGQQNGLKFDNELAKNLEMGTYLVVLGYPLGMAATSGSNISPIYGSCVVSTSGLDRGVILTSDRNFEHGNSGGPVFYKTESGEFIVIGIISAGVGDGIGFIVPISATR